MAVDILSRQPKRGEEDSSDVECEAVYNPFVDVAQSYARYAMLRIARLVSSPRTAG